MELCDNKNYYQAVIECVKVYCDKVRETSGATTQARESELMRFAFNPTKREAPPIVLSTVNDEISKNIQKGHGLLSQGLVYGVKNPAVSHSSQENLAQRGLFTEDDCLDILSLVSYLFRRIEKRGAPPTQD